MVKTEFIEAFKNKLKDIFCKENQGARRYSEIWLSKADFGGLYNSDKYLLNVKASHNLKNCNEEIEHVVDVLYSSLSPEEIAYIWRIIVYNSNEEPSCLSDDISVLVPEQKC